MSSGPARRGLLTAAAGAVVDFLVEREEEPTSLAPAAPTLVTPPAAQRPLIAVIGLRPRCGATTVARALAAELARRDSGGAAVVSPGADGRGLPLGLPAATRLARLLGSAPGLRVRPTGRICLADALDRETLLRAVGRTAPLVLDVSDPVESASVAALVDAVVVVAAPSSEASLATAFAQSLGRVGPAPLVVVNRARGGVPGWEGRCALAIPESRMGAQLALAGREPRGVLGEALAALADVVEERLP